ncbi:TolC family outer membrane protein [Methylomonas sp. SURF-2]|uniref:TolC family outer membrane protein n=1 Tax=Methylomonas subterranea TaxID=2952225 RepID=A0ABT1TBJ6_9GAMM|nr:TolC family outer membrane protein [Methylomonas sp. SURF-2]MCQ8102835.1 TolC family outer membrane protein [Methylomonas sp. SURF-2]
MVIKRIKLVLLTATLLRAKCVFSEDLLTVYQQALEADPALKSAMLKLDIVAAQKQQAVGEMLPQVTASANWSANNQRLSSVGSTATSNYKGTRYVLSVNQSLIDFAKFWNWRRAQEVENQYSAESIEARHVLIDSVVDKYFSVLEAEDQLFFFGKEKQATEKQLEQVKKQYAKQLLKITDLYEVEARLDQIQASEIEAETILVRARESLKALSNTTPARLFKLRDDIDFKPLEGELDDWIAVAKSENPVLAAQISALAAASDDVVMQKSKHLPVVDLQFNYYNTDTGYQSARTPETEVQVAAINVTMPIFSGGITSQRVNEAQLRLALTENENEAKVRALIKETSDAFLSSNASVRRVKATVKALESSRKSREAKEKGFKYGVETISDVLDAQQVEFRAERDLSQAKYGYIKNRIRFMHAIGLISVENLMEINEWLQQPATQ